MKILIAMLFVLFAFFPTTGKSDSEEVVLFANLCRFGSCGMWVEYDPNLMVGGTPLWMRYAVGTINKPIPKPLMLTECNGIFGQTIAQFLRDWYVGEGGILKEYICVTKGPAAEIARRILLGIAI